MKILIVSDIHGNFDNMKKVLKDNPNFDCMFLVGDLLAGPEIEGYNPKKLANLLNGYKDKIIAVRGNCDYEYDIKLLNFDINKLYIKMTIDKKIFLMKPILIQ